jgi:hypothetical protein
MILYQIIDLAGYLHGRCTGPAGMDFYGLALMETDVVAEWSKAGTYLA